MKRFISFLFFSVTCFSAYAQTRGQQLDSIYFENLFTPNFSSLLMPKGFTEVIVSNSLLSYNRAFQDGSKTDPIFRRTDDLTTTIVNVGVAKDNRFNAGIEIHYRKAYQDSDPGSSPLNIFKGSPPNYVFREQGLTSVGPRIKWRPFKHNLNFVYITTVQLPTQSKAKEYALSARQVQWGNTFLYSLSGGKHLVFFLQDDVYTYFKATTVPRNQYLNALNAYGYLLVSKHFFPFVSAGYSAIFQKDVSGANRSSYAPVGVGLQYQQSLRFTLNIYYNQNIYGRNYPDYHTLNLGVRGVF